ncbi:MAG: hypothetical protein JO320_14355 [Alphaproteobacteria bacterium]|nr:hypothetical protein [Alphaproteobacteria bacterium]
MDLNLPEINGWEGTHRFKADPATSEIPIIALSGHVMTGDWEEGARHRLRRLRHQAH